MKGLEEALFEEMSVLSTLYTRLSCKNTADCLRKNLGRFDRSFADAAMKALYGDVRATKFATEIAGSNPKLMGVMRRSTLTSLDLLAVRLSVEPSKKAKYRRTGLMPFDVERNWFLNRFNADVQKYTESLPRSDEDPVKFVRNTFKIYASFVKNIHKPYSDLYKHCMKNILGTNAKELPSLIEENFSVDSVFLLNGRPMSDIRYLRKAYREKRYIIKGNRISFEGVDPTMPRIEYTLGELLLMILFLQMKVLVLSSVFCIVDVNKLIGAALYQRQ